MLASSACEDVSDDEPMSSAGSSGDDDEARCDAAIDEVLRLCPPPHHVDVIADGQRPPLLDIAVSAVALDDGYFLARIDEGGDVAPAAFVLEDNAQCRVACVMACDLAAQSLCIAVTSTEDEAVAAPGCMFCGAVTEPQCQPFVDACGP